MNTVYTLNIKDTQRKASKQQVEDQQKNSDSELTENGVAILAVIAGVLFGPFVLWAAWNLCIPALFGLPGINYLQSLALYCLIKILK